MATKIQYTQNRGDQSSTNQGQTKRGGRPQPGAGNAGDDDKPRKSPTGPQTAEEKLGKAQANKSTGKRPAAKKPSTAPGRKQLRRSA